ncbi:hypothetical protein DRN67_00925 [Candidatus Micrarchaeota archaeon]|nr:MAG: hypothetical protein DRN67_00925 [Candidatus Micrarchaeota archaeon]
MKSGIILLSIALLLSVSSAAFHQIYHNFQMNIREDGSAHVLEEFQLYMDSNESSNFYDSIMSLNDISAWKNVTSIENMRIHVNTRYAQVDNVRIRAQRKESCNPWTGTCYGVVRMEYDIRNIEPGTFIGVTSEKPRTYNYTFNPRALSFSLTEEGNIAIPDKTELTINLPNDSVITRLNNFPDYFTTTSLPITGISQLKWAGPEVLAGFELQFTREEPLETEVISFFKSLQSDLVDLLRSDEGLAILLMLVVVLVSIVLLRKYREARVKK